LGSTACITENPVLYYFEPKSQHEYYGIFHTLSISSYLPQDVRRHNFHYTAAISLEQKGSQKQRHTLPLQLADAKLCTKNILIMTEMPQRSQLHVEKDLFRYLFGLY
jgi:hypothetical protein